MLSLCTNGTASICSTRVGEGHLLIKSSLPASADAILLKSHSENRFSSSGVRVKSWKFSNLSQRQRVRSRNQIWHSFIVCSSGTQAVTNSRTQRILESMPKLDEAGGAGGTSSYEALKRLDKLWERIRSTEPGTEQSRQLLMFPSIPCILRMKTYGNKNVNTEVMEFTATGPAPEVVRQLDGQMSSNSTPITVAGNFDVIVCGGTLGVFVATSLAQRGFKVAVVEKGQLRGRVQEWNISRKELYELVKIGVLTAEEAEGVIAIEFNPNRVGFGAGSEIWVKDILNLGVSPAKLIDTMKQRFLQAGGAVFEGTGFSKADVFDDVAVVYLDNGKMLKSRLLLDCMGNASPIVRQVRWGQRPDGVCLVVGTCASGFENNTTGDVIFTNLPVMDVGSSKLQLFWEAFPAASGPTDRTTYLFTYVDATPERPSLEELLNAYWDLLPGYQGVKLEDLEILRVLYGFFSTYRNSPLSSAYDRILQVGDASGIQSPLSFGGFGSITRHLERLTNGLVDALQCDVLEKDNLSLLNPYMPSLSGAWLLQRAMSVPVGANPPPEFVNELLSTNFSCMKKQGDSVMRPFLQDVIQFGPLARTMVSMILVNPGILPQIFEQVGIVPLFDWLVHFVGLGYFTFLSSVAAPLLQSWVASLENKQQFYWRRRFEAWKFGAGLDYSLD